MTSLAGLAPAASRNVIALMAAGMAGRANLRAFDSALPQLADSLGTTLGQTGHFAAAFALAYGLAQIPFGVMGDRMDRPTLVRGLAVASALVMLLTAFASSYGEMLGLRLLAGAMASAVIPLTIGHIGDTIPFERRQIVLALNMTVLIVGLVLGQVAGGAIADLAGWHGIPIFIALLYLPAIVALRSERAASAGRRPPPLSLARTLRRLAAAPFARAVLSAGFLEGATIFSVAAFFGILLAVRFDLSPGVVGLLLMANALGSVFNLLVLRSLPPGWSLRAHFTLGGAAAVVGLVIAGLSGGLAATLAGLFLAGFGAAAMHNTLQTCASQMLPEARSTSFATFATTFFLSQAAGGVVLAWLLDRAGTDLLLLWPVPLLLLLVVIVRRALAAGGPAA